MVLKEQLHRAGCIVYEELLDPQLKRTAMEMFMDMDTNGGGSVSLQELTAQCDSSMRDFVGKMFRLLDTDNSGFLDFDECKALFFLGLCHSTWGASAWRSCDSCGDSVLDFIYTCSACLAQSNIYFDLCSNCYPAAVRSHVPAHRSQFERHDLKVADVIDKILTEEESAREKEIPTFTNITHNHFHVDNNTMPPGRSDSANASSSGAKVKSATRRAVEAVSFVSEVVLVVSACSIM